MPTEVKLGKLLSSTDTQLRRVTGIGRRRECVDQVKWLTFERFEF